MSKRTFFFRQITLLGLICISMRHSFAQNLLEGITIGPRPTPSTGPQQNSTSGNSTSTQSSAKPAPAPAPSPFGGEASQSEAATNSDKSVTADGILLTGPATGKFEEYQSICRSRDFDSFLYRGPQALAARVAELKALANQLEAQKTEMDREAALQTLRDLTEAGDMKTFKVLFVAMKQLKLTPKENNILNAMNALSMRNYRSAREELLKVVEEFKEDEFSLTTLAQVFIKEMNFFEAAAIYEDLNKIKKNKYLPELCEALVLNSHNAEGEDACIEAAEKFPDNPYPLIFAGITHRERDAKKRAASLFKRSLNIRQTEMANVCLAELSLIDNKPEEAVNYFKLSLEQSPHSPRAMLGLAWSQVRARNFDGALEAFRQACKVNKKYEVEVRKAYKKLTEDKILNANQFMKLAQNCQ